MSGRLPGEDPFETAAALIRDVAAEAERARRYRTLAAQVAEPTFERALAIGTLIRQRFRQPVPETGAVATLIDELQSLRRHCAAAVAERQADADYRQLLDAVAVEAWLDVARLAPPVFTGVEPYPDAPALHWSVAIAGRRAGSHFVSPDECARRIARVAADGFPAETPAPELGADEHVPVVLLSDEPDATESPLALVLERSPLPVCRIEGTTVALVYGRRLRADLHLWCAPEVSDEWWSVRPDAYRRYLADVQAALSGAGLSLPPAR